MTFKAKEDPVASAEVNEEEVIEIPANGDSDAEAEQEVEKIVFHKPDEKMSLHIKPLYIFAYLDGVKVNRVMIDNGAAVNILPFASLRKLSKSVDDLIHTDVTASGFAGDVNRARGVLPVELTVGSKTSVSAFFVIDASTTYNALLGRDWIHSNWCIRIRCWFSGMGAE